MTNCFSALMPARFARIFKSRSRSRMQPANSVPASASTIAETKGGLPMVPTQAQDAPPPLYSALGLDEAVFDEDVRATIDAVIAEHSSSLRKLSLDIHDHPELRWKEHHAHDALTKYMDKQGGWKVTRHYLDLDTAWRAEWSRGSGGRTIGVNSEMDALPGIGHACGHSLIAIAGVGVALALRAAMEKHDISGTVVLLGTPAEEGGAGKGILLDRGGYDGMDVCVMSHPGAGDVKTAAIGSSLAIQTVDVEYHGHTAHAGAAPWEGQNALDAAVLAYNAVSVLRQQIKTTHRIHGIIEGKNWAPNIIPDYARMRWLIRAPTSDEVAELNKRLVNCLKAAALATACKTDFDIGLIVKDLHPNETLGHEFARAIRKYGYEAVVGPEGSMTASTDFGNVTYTLPSIHPNYSIPSPPGSSNHTIGFTEAARTPEAHERTLEVTKALAIACVRVLRDDDFFDKIQDEFDRFKRSQ